MAIELGVEPGKRIKINGAYQERFAFTGLGLPQGEGHILPPKAKA